MSRLDIEISADRWEELEQLTQSLKWNTDYSFETFICDPSLFEREDYSLAGEFVGGFR